MYAFYMHQHYTLVQPRLSQTSPSLQCSCSDQSCEALLHPVVDSISFFFVIMNHFWSRCTILCIVMNLGIAFLIVGGSTMEMQNCNLDCMFASFNAGFTTLEMRLIFFNLIIFMKCSCAHLQCTCQFFKCCPSANGNCGDQGQITWRRFPTASALSFATHIYLQPLISLLFCFTPKSLDLLDVHTKYCRFFFLVESLELLTSDLIQCFQCHVRSKFLLDIECFPQSQPLLISQKE